MQTRDLSKRQREVADLVTEGLSTPEIAAELGISVSTVVQHLQSMYAKTGMRNRTEFAVWWTRQEAVGEPGVDPVRS